MLLSPPTGYCGSEDNAQAGSFGTTLTAHATPHTKGNYSELIAATTYESFGITIHLANTAAGNGVAADALVDIAIGGAGSEQVLIPNLICGNVSAQDAGAVYRFPIYIPAGVRIAARAQALITADTVDCAIWLDQWPVGGPDWVGTRVTAYGPDTATSSGAAHSPGSSVYATATQLSASIDNKIIAMQFGYDLRGDTTASTARGLLRIGFGAAPTYAISDVPFSENSGEFVGFANGNMVLSNKRFNIPAGNSLHVSAMRNVAAEARGFAVYGVD